MKGGSLNIWEKKYNNTITGESWDYPEFKGYYSLFYGMKLDCPTPFEVYSGKEDVTLHLFTPAVQEQYDPKRNHTIVDYPKGNLSFMNAIPAVGTKFGKAEDFGPQSQPHRARGNGPENNVSGKLLCKGSLTSWSHWITDLGLYLLDAVYSRSLISFRNDKREHYGHGW